MPSPQPGRPDGRAAVQLTPGSHAINIGPGDALTRDEFEQRMHEWRDSENLAAQAEERVRSVGQAAADPRMAQLLQQARELRAKADAQLAAIMASLKAAVAKNRS